MIGYYVHHHGVGHLHRAEALAAQWTRTYGEQVAGLSSLTRPIGWAGPWVMLPRDEVDAGDPDEPTAGGHVHWAPLGSTGLRRRMAAIASWVGGAEAPRAVVVDVSVEVVVLVRLLGVPVVSVVLPGRRTDAAHLTGFRMSSALVGCWPAEMAATPYADMTPDLPDDVLARIEPIGAVSRFAAGDATPAREGRAVRHGVLLRGRGGRPAPGPDVAALRRRLPGWSWEVLGGANGWSSDPTSVLASADVVLTSAGQGSLADVAVSRRPAIVVPEPRPHEEQVTTAEALRHGRWPVVVAPDLTAALTPDALDRAASLAGSDWEGWVDGHAVDRLHAVVDRVALPSGKAFHVPRQVIR